jgi:hypothetical protein
MYYVKFRSPLTPFQAFIVGYGSILDLGATYRCPECGRAHHEPARAADADEQVVIDDWNVIADDFLRQTMPGRRRRSDRT